MSHSFFFLNEKEIKKKEAEFGETVPYRLKIFKKCVFISRQVVFLLYIIHSITVSYFMSTLLCVMCAGVYIHVHVCV